MAIATDTLQSLRDAAIADKGTTIIRSSTLIRLLDTIEATLRDAEADKARLDWLSDKDNPIGNVQLPTVCVMNNLHNMRGAIDEAMRLDPEIVKSILEAAEDRS